MLEYISIDPQVFLNREAIAMQQKTSMLENKKIKELLELDCFNEKISYVPKRHHNNKHSLTTTSSVQPMRQKHLSYHDKLMREVVGNLNKINTSNLSTICKRIQIIIDRDNFHEICLIVLNSACNEHSAYMYQLLEIFQSIQENLTDILKTSIEDFANTIINTFESNLMLMSNLDYNNYDEYCLFLKKKHIINNQFIILYKLIKDDNVTSIALISFDTIFDLLLINFNLYQNHSVHMQICVMELMFEFFKNLKTEYMHGFAKFLEIVDTTNLSTKAKFVFEDILLL